MGAQSLNPITGLTNMQETFCVLVAGGKTRADAAVAAGYSAKTAKAQGSQQAMKPSVKARIAELVQLATTGAVLSITARMERLSVFALEENRTEKGSLIRGGNIEAIKELNKMTNVYVRQPHSGSPPVLNILVADSTTAEILTRIASGERRLGEGIREGEEIKDINETGGER